MRICKDVDRNGNSVVNVYTDKGTFSIQTNGNLPDIHNKSIPHPREADYDEARAIAVYVQDYGTDRQKRIASAGAKRYRKLDPDDPDYEEKRDEQWEEAKKDARSGDVISLSDLMSNSGL